MIPPEMLAPPLRVLQQLIIQAKIKAYEVTGDDPAQFLNDFELVPECLADDSNRADELLVTFRGLSDMYPSCRRIVDEFDSSTSLTT